MQAENYVSETMLELKLMRWKRFPFAIGYSMEQQSSATQFNYKANCVQATAYTLYVQ